LVHGDEIVDSQTFELIVEGDSEEVELDDGSARSMASKRLKLSEDQISDAFTVPVCTVGELL
jgi:hypothetical protein